MYCHNKDPSTTAKLRRPADLREDLLILLDKEQRRLLRLCGILESLADRLPGSFASNKTGRVLRLLEKAFAFHVFLHERCLFPLVRSCSDDLESIEPILRQLEYEHAAEHGLIIELLENSAPALSSGVDTKAFGYILRSFFDNYRRHASWERTILYPMARTLLTPARLPLWQAAGRLPLPGFPLNDHFYEESSSAWAAARSRPRSGT